MKKIISLLLAVVMTVGLLAGISFAADPIAQVMNGNDVVECATAEEIKALINPDGTTVVKMLKDYQHAKGAFLHGIPSVTVDLNGHTVQAPGNCIGNTVLGTKNTTTVVKNGTVVSGSHGVRSVGGVRIENCTVVGGSTSAIATMARVTTYNNDNLVTGSTLIGTDWVPIAFNSSEGPQHGVAIKVENSTLLSYNTHKDNALLCTWKGGGEIIFGDNVTMYGLVANYKEDAVTASGNTVSQTQTGTASYKNDALGLNLTGLNEWKTTTTGKGNSGPVTSGSTTVEPSTPSTPTTTEALAEVMNGTDVVKVNTIAEIKALINADGTTVVKMLKDYNLSSGTFLHDVPTFTLDLNGHTVQAKSNVVGTTKIGTKNTTTVVKNGTVISGSHGVRSSGGLTIENCTVVGGKSSALGYYATSADYNAGNVVKNSTVMGTDWVPIAFNATEAQNGVTVTVENSTLLSYNTHKDNALLCTRTKGGEIIFGAGVTMYGLVANYKEDAVAESGNAVSQTQTGTASYKNDALSLNLTGLNEWKTGAAAAVEIADFADVAKDFWGYTAIMNAAKAGLVKGKSQNADGTMNYVPNASMTRAEFITVICRYFYPAEASAVQAGAKWWTGYYDLAMQKGILTVSDLDYGDLDKAMSREEMALVLSRTAPAQAAYASVTPADSAKIPDYANVSEAYQTAVLWAYGAGLLKGVDTVGTFNPKGELNRAAVATIFNSLLSSK